jgi:hypothetical protein
MFAIIMLHESGWLDLGEGRCEIVDRQGSCYFSARYDRVGLRGVVVHVLMYYWALRSD